MHYSTSELTGVTIWHGAGRKKSDDPLVASRRREFIGENGRHWGKLKQKDHNCSELHWEKRLINN